MTDQTPVTDDDRRKAHEWARMAADNNHDPHNVPWRVAARLFLDHVPAPTATLADELRTASWGDIPALADRVEAVEKERDEARTKVEEVEGHLSKSWRQRDAKDVELERLSREREQQEKALVEHGRLLAEARAAFDEVENRNLNLEADLRESHAEMERLTATFKEPLKEPGHLPDPADVPNGEAWVVRYKEEQCNGVKAYVGWAIADSYGLRTNIRNDEVTLVSRLVPDTRRVIDRSENLDALPVGSIVLDQHGEPWRQRQMDWEGRNYRRDSENLIEVEGSVTVIYTPRRNHDPHRRRGARQ